MKEMWNDNNWLTSETVTTQFIPNRISFIRTIYIWMWLLYKTSYRDLTKT